MIRMGPGYNHKCAKQREVEGDVMSEEVLGRWQAGRGEA